MSYATPLTGCFAGVLWTVISLENSALAQSQILRDNTLGAESSQVIQNFNGLPIEVINGGAIRGANLFHSFQEFNVSEGRGAYFLSPVNINNILARVTGTNPSNILGILGVNGNANLFLMNPNGIVFGPNASLSLNGSFIATTANAIALRNGDIFSTNIGAPLPNQLLTVNPNAFFFNQIAAKPIVNQAPLAVPLGQSLMLVGGEVRVDGGILQAPGGRVELAGVAGEGQITLNGAGNTLSLNVPSNLELADVSLTNRAIVNVAGNGGGSITINASNLNILSGSNLSAGIAGGGTMDTQGEDITLNALNTLTIADGSSVFNGVFGLGKVGNVRMNTRQFLLRDGVVANSIRSPEGRAGSIILNASESAEITATAFDGTTTINTVFSPFPIPRVPVGLLVSAVGEGSSNEAITITTSRLTLQDGARLSSGTDSSRQGGIITIRASDVVKLMGTSANGTPTLISSGTQGSGDAGEIMIETGRLIVRDGAIVTTGTSKQGQGGKLTVRASESVSRLLFDTSNAGDAGELTITTSVLRVLDGGQVSARTSGTGRAGVLQVTASDTLDVSGTSANGQWKSGLYFDTSSSADARGISINTGDLVVQNGGQVTVSGRGTGTSKK